MNRINVQYAGRNTVFSYRDIMRQTGEVYKNIDIQTLQEIYNDNVYRINPDHLKGERIVVDLGANIGAFTLMAASMGASRVYAVEPNADNCKYLNLNIAQNNFEHRIQVIPKAIWTSNKTIKMDDLDRDSRIDQVSHLESNYSKEVTHYESPASFTASTITLDQLIVDNTISEIDFLKMDIEWSEYELIPSWSDETMRKIKFIAMEFHGTDIPTLGNMMAHLTREFSIETLGSHERGGFIFARRY